jgi:DNA-binding protein YbaB
MTVEAMRKNGAVKVTANGKQKILSIKNSAEAVERVNRPILKTDIQSSYRRFGKIQKLADEKT